MNISENIQKPKNGNFNPNFSLKGKKNKSKLVGESVMLLIQSALIFVVGFILFQFKGPKGEKIQFFNKHVT